MKPVTNKIIFFFSFIWACLTSFALAQLRSDFILADGGYDTRMAFDREGKLHVTWGDPRGHDIDWRVYYGLFYSLGNTLRNPSQITPDFGGMMPSIAVQANHVVLAWRYGATYIKGQIFSIAGDPLSEILLFNEQTDLTASSPSIAFYNDTTFIVVWSDHRGPDGIYGQISTVTGRLIGSNMLLSDHFSTQFFRFPKALRLNEDTIIFLWHDKSLGREIIFGRLFYHNGIPKGSSFLISEDPELEQVWNLTAAMNPATGDFTVIWNGLVDSLWQIQMRRFKADGTPLSPSEQINSTTTTGAIWISLDMAYDYDGKAVVVWEQQEYPLVRIFTKIFAQRFLTDGTRFGGNFHVSVIDTATDQATPAVVLRNDKIYTVWSTSKDAATHSYIIWANILDFYDPTSVVKNNSSSILNNFVLNQNYPNPFNTATVIPFDLPHSSDLDLEIYNIMGKKVRTLLAGKKPTGHFEMQWDGTDDLGNAAASGIYFVWLQTTKQSNESVIQVQKLILLR